MIKLTIHLDMDKKSSGFVFISISYFNAELCVLQANYRKSIRELDYVRSIYTMKDMSKRVQDQLLQYCQICYTNMGFDDIIFSQKNETQEFSIMNSKHQG